MKLSFLLLFFPFLLFAQEQENQAIKDQFSLEGLLDLCQKSNNPEELEKRLNSPETAIHNFDLNADAQVDYLNVEEVTEGQLHILFIRTMLNEQESQDIAWIEIEKTGEQQAFIKAMADSALFEEALALEPIDEKEMNNKGKGGPMPFEVAPAFVRVNVWGWPLVRTIYAPAYRPWRSPWRYRQLPPWYAPRKPVSVIVFKPRMNPYKMMYRPVPFRPAAGAHRLYKMHRRQAKMAHRHHHRGKQQRRR